MNEKQSSRPWEYIGKVATVLTIVGGLILISQWLNPDGPKLQARGQYYIWPYELTNVSGKSFWQISIENIGSEIAKNIRIDVPSNGSYVLDASTEISNVNQSIRIRDLQPTDKISLMMWLDLAYPEIYKNEIKIIHDNGIANIDYSIQVKGITAWIIENGVNILFGLIILISLTFTVLVAVLENKQKR